MEELLLKIKYSMTLDEIGEGFKLFQKKYQFKKSLVFTLVYLIALGLGIDFLIRDHTGIYGYILVGLSLGMIFYTWYKPVLIRKKLIATISSLAEETYTAEFYRDRIQITTVIEEPVIAENETKTEMSFRRRTEQAERNIYRKINTLIDIKESERKSEWKKTLKNSAQPLKS